MDLCNPRGCALQADDPGGASALVIRDVNGILSPHSFPCYRLGVVPVYLSGYETWVLLQSKSPLARSTEIAMGVLPKLDPSTLALDLSSTPYSRDAHVMTQDAASMRHGASPHAPKRSYTVTDMKPSSSLKVRVNKRIIVCCDGCVVYPTQEITQRYADQR